MGLLEKLENQANEYLKKTIDSKNIVQKLFRAHAYKIVLTGAVAFGTIFGTWSAYEKINIARNNKACVELAVQERKAQLDQEYEYVSNLGQKLVSLQGETEQVQNQAIESQRELELEKNEFEERKQAFENRVKDQLEDIENTKKSLEFDRDFIEHREKRLEEKESVLTSLLDARKEALDRESKEIEEREKIIEKIDKRVVESAQDKAGTSLCFVQRFDVNRNYLLDDLDSEISKEFLGNISIVSPEYLSSVRIIYSPEVLKKLSRYNLQGKIVSVNDRLLLACEKNQIKRIITGIPRDALYDFQMNSKGKEGIDQILSNTKASEYQPVYIFVPELCGASGFVLGNNYVATAHHVVSDLDSFIVKLPNGKEIKASQDSVIAYSKEYDLAVLKLDFQGYAPALLQDNLAIGEKIFMTRSCYSKNFEKGKSLEGYLYALDSVIFDSLISDREDMPRFHGTDRYKITINATYGDSGSAMLNRQGEIVGIASSTQHGLHGSVCVVRARYLRKLLEFYAKKAE